mgnify:CR=1 FL=1
MNILTRQGSKRRIAKDVIAHFPKHDMYVELFFGTGAIFFEKELAKYNILNDLDNLVYSLWIIMQDKRQREELVETIRQTPYHQQVFQDLRVDKIEDTQIFKALRLLVLSNFSLLSSGETMKFGFTNAKKLLVQKLVDFNSSLGDGASKLEFAQFTSCDFREVLKRISFRGERDIERTFIYADPPYINTNNNYNTPKYGKQDFEDLIKLLIDSKIKFAVSEFDDSFVLENAKKNNLNVIEIGERLNLKNRRTEILITNYEK